MLLPFSVRIAERPPIWERAFHSVNCACLSWALVKFCGCPSSSFDIEGGMWISNSGSLPLLFFSLPFP